MTGRILVVDDDAQLLASLALGLPQRGFRVLTASSADGALRVLESETVDAVLTDLNMPGLSGIEFCERVASSHPRLSYTSAAAGRSMSGRRRLSRSRNNIVMYRPDR